MMSEQTFSSTTEHALELAAENEYNPLLPSLVATLHIDKKVGSLITDENTLSRLCAYFWVVEGQDFMACINLKKSHMTTSDFHAIGLMAIHLKLCERSAILERSAPLMVMAESRNALAKISYEDFKILREFYVQLIPDELVRNVSWRTEKILEEVLQEDLGL
jgi:hypothetical protein